MTSKWLIGIVAALGLGVLTLPTFLTHDDDHGGATAGAQCNAGPAKLDLTMKDMQGKDFRLADLKGKVVLLNFWATWCAPCRAEIPDFVTVYNEHKDKGFVIVGVLTEDSPDQVPPFVSEMKMNYPITMITPEMEDAYGPLFGLPASVLIARDGSVCKRHFGPMSKEMLQKEIKPLL
jgi:thiol-disulfide isomerase/thioredoxin